MTGTAPSMQMILASASRAFSCPHLGIERIFPQCWGGACDVGHTKETLFVWDIFREAQPTAISVSSVVLLSREGHRHPNEMSAAGPPPQQRAKGIGFGL